MIIDARRRNERNSQQSKAIANEIINTAGQYPCVCVTAALDGRMRGAIFSFCCLPKVFLIYKFGFEKRIAGAATSWQSGRWCFWKNISIPRGARVFISLKRKSP